MKSKTGRICKLIISLLFAVAICSSTVMAESYQSYVWDLESGTYYLAPDAMQYSRSISAQDLVDANGQSIGAFANPTDITVGPDHLIYITDTDNNRFVVLNPDFTLNKVISSFRHTITDANGNQTVIDDVFNQPGSIFVTENDGMYICDTTGLTSSNVDAADASKVGADNEAGRIIHLDQNMNVIRIIWGVSSPVLPDDFVFRPSKVAVDDAGRIFVVNANFNMGLIELGRDGAFVQTLGAPAVQYNLIDLMWRAISTEAQEEQMSTFQSTEFNNLDITEDGFVYVTLDTYDEEGTLPDFLKKLNAKGGDVLKKMSDEYEPFGDLRAVGFTSDYNGPARLCDVTALDNDMYAVLDRERNRVFVYNEEGQNLFEFGSPPDDRDGMYTSYVNGTLSSPVSMDWMGDTCLVLDSALDTVNVYTPTEYGARIFEATRLHAADRYDEESQVWQEVLVLNNNSAAAKDNLGQVAYRNEDWPTAMKYFKEIYNVTDYSKAYKYQRQVLIEQNFIYGVIGIVALIVLIVVIKKLWKKFVPKADEKSYWGRLGYCKTVIFRPLNGFWNLTKEGRGGAGAATTILIVASLISVLQARFTGFIFNPEAESTNLIVTMLTLIVPILLFTICSWAVTSLMSGEGTLKDLYIGACYSTTPIIILYPISIILSNIMVEEEGNLYQVFLTIALIWVLLLLFSSCMRINDYTLGKAVGVTIIIVVVMVLVVFLAILFFALIQQMIEFVENLGVELTNRA